MKSQARLRNASSVDLQEEREASLTKQKTTRV